MLAAALHAVLCRNRRRRIVACRRLPLNDLIPTRPGRWGERFVFEHLRLSLPAARVEWINADTETGLPYDLTISSVGAERVFVEVKTSSARSKPFFEVSLAELDCARQNGGNYVIYRVTGAGSEHVRLACLPNPVGCLTVGGFTLQLSEVGTQAVR